MAFELGITVVSKGWMDRHTLAIHFFIGSRCWCL